MSSLLSRRDFFQKWISSGVFLGSTVLVVSGCASGENKEGGTEKNKPADNHAGAQATEPVKANSGGDPCTDYSGLSQDDLKARTAMGYVPQSLVEEKHCNNCNLYLPPPEGTPCGRCQLFKGPVTVNGYCTYWAPQI